MDLLMELVAILQERPDARLIIYAGFALSAFLLVTGTLLLMSRSELRSEARNRRLKMIANGSSTAEILQILKAAERRHPVEHLPLIGGLPRMLRQSGLTMTPGRFLILCCIVSLVLATLLSIRIAPAIAAPAGLGLGFAIPFAVLNQIRNRRLDKISALLPDALDLMARGLRVGHPLNTSIAAVAEEMPDPVGTEFGVVADQITFGDDLVDAFAEFAARIDLEDVNYLAASIAIQHGTGGDLAKIIDTLSGTIRSRMSLRRRIKAISAEGRLTAYFLSALPFIILLVNWMTNPQYYLGIKDDPLFIPMFATITIFVVLNAVILRRLIQIRY